MRPSVEKKRYTQSFLPVMEGKTLVRFYLDDVTRLPRELLSREEEQELGKRIEAGEQEAYNEFIARNVRLVMSIAKKYITPGLQLGFDYVDLIQEGNIGMLTAIRKYDWRLGFKFSTYASWWIHQRITKALNDGGIIRVPVYVRESTRRVSRALIEILEETGKAPSVDEISKRTGLSPDIVAVSLDVLGTKSHIHSLEKELSNGHRDNPLLLIDTLVDHYSSAEFDWIERQTPKLREIMAAILTPRQLFIIELRFGFQGRALTLEEVGRELGVTRERIRQIQRKALYKLFRHDFFRAVFRERFGTKPPDEFSPLAIEPTEGRRRSTNRDNGHHPLEAERRELLTRWESDLVEIPENEIELLANM